MDLRIKLFYKYIFKLCVFLNKSAKEYLERLEENQDICNLWRCGWKVIGSEHKGHIYLGGERPIGFSDKFSLSSSYVHVQNMET